MELHGIEGLCLVQAGRNVQVFQGIKEGALLSSGLRVWSPQPVNGLRCLRFTKIAKEVLLNRRRLLKPKLSLEARIGVSSETASWRGVGALF